MQNVRFPAMWLIFWHFFQRKIMASKSKRGSDKPSVDSSTKPTDDYNDSSKPVEDSNFSDSSKPSDDPVASKPADGSNSNPDNVTKVSHSQSHTDGSKASQEQESGSLSIILNAKVKTSKQVPVKAMPDYYASWITGCTFLPNGYAVICDHSNNSIKLLDSNFNIQGRLNVSYPGDVAVLDNNNVIVTLSSEEQLMRVQVSPSLQAGETFEVGKKCYGVDVANGLIFVACHSNFSEVPDGEIRVFDYDGILVKRIGAYNDGSCMFKSSHNLAVSSCGTRVFVSDLATRSVYCIGMDSKLIYQYKDASLKGPRNMYIDANNNALVCDFDNSAVQVITADGRKRRDLLSSENDIKHPNSVALRPSDGTLIVGCADKDNLFVFTLC